MTQIYTMFHAGSTVENQAVVVEDQEGPPVSAVGINELTLQPGSGKGNVTNGRNVTTVTTFKYTDSLIYEQIF